MSLSARFENAQLRSMSLAKVGNPLREEALQTSKQLCRFVPGDAELLTHCFLKSFRRLELHQFVHHSSLEQNELYSYVANIFEDNDQLVEQGGLIAKHLYAKSRHPNIKSGDLCIALIDGIGVADNDDVQAVSIIKSESKVPFLQISEQDGDLVLRTQQGIYPDKIDKGCLIINHGKENGFWVYLFDKGGGDTHFWNRDFVAAQPVQNEDYLTRRYSELCVAFAEKGLAEDHGQEERAAVAANSISYLNDKEDFDLAEFKKETFADEPEMVEKFDTFKEEYEESSGTPLEESFKVSKPEAEKAKKKLKSRLRLDTGAEISFSSGFLDSAHLFMERGRDADKDMQFVKIYFHEEV